MAPRLARLLALVLLAAGLWHLAGGLAIPLKAALAQALLDRAWQQAAQQAGQQGARAPRPWPWADTAAVARLRVPRLGVDQIVLAGATGRTLAFGPGLVDGTGPVGPGEVGAGEVGATVISGHRDTHFAWLAGLRIGDTLSLRHAAEDRPRDYRIVARRIMDARHDAIHAPIGADLLFLTSCYPLDAVDPGGPLRIVFVAIRQPNRPAAVEISARSD